jgi:hypothetical protein
MPYFAQFGDDIAPLIASVLVFMIPIIAILTAHQRKMAEIIHRSEPSPAQSDEMAALRAEISRLTQALHQNTIAIDAMARNPALPPGPKLANEDQPQFLTGR